MNLKFFIDRPVFSIVISTTIVFMGILALFNLPVEQYPDIAPPTISVFAMYPGANAETVRDAVIVPLEEAINGVENMDYITSTASNAGDASITVYFKQGSNADMAAVNIQNRVAAATSTLPAEVIRNGIKTEKEQNSELKTIALYSEKDKYDRQFLNNYMKINVEPRIKRVNGVGKVMLYGTNYSMRIWLNPEKMAQYKLVPADITQVLETQNMEASTGSFGENHDNAYEYSMKYRGRFSTSEEFGNLVIRSLPNGEVLRLKEIAKVELGDEAYNYSTLTNGHESAIASIYQTSGSNAAATINNIDKALEELGKEMPEGLKFVSLSDTNRFLYASISDVIKTLLEAILLVVIIVYVFLQDIRSTVIPTISIFVSIIGTFAVMQILGFSINLLTLFALVLAIGTVVDDAIVVVEAVQAKFDAGYRSPYLAANDAAKSVSSAILTSTLIFMVVFIPVSMIGGVSGAYYRQFGLTMAVAVGISAINAFTLSPMLCALLLRPYLDEDGSAKNNFAARFRKAFNVIFDKMSERYAKGVNLFIKRRWAVWSLLVMLFLLLGVFIKTTKTGLIPDEDTGSLTVSMNTKPGTSASQNRVVMNQMNDRLKQIPEIEYSAMIEGFSFNGSGSSSGMFMVSLRDWSERKGNEHSIDNVIERINDFATGIPDAETFTSASSMIAGYGMGNGIDLILQDKMSGDMNEFKQAADNFVEVLQQRPEIEMVYSSFKTDFPQYLVDIDAAKCMQAGTTPSEVLQTLSDYYSGNYASNFNRFSKIYTVKIQADPSYRVTPESLNHIFLRTGNEMAPLSQFVKLTKTYGPSGLSRHNLFNSISITGSAASGYSSGEVLKAIRETAQQSLPKNYTFEYGGISREENKTTNNTVIIFGISFILIYLILSALYGSFITPFAILLSVPVGLLGCFAFTKIFGLENNIYMQTGLVMLIGLLSKTAILITEYAAEERKKGKSLTEAATIAAKVRLRPILMTALTMIFGLFPLLITTGVSANGNRSLATGAVGGMCIGTLALLFLVPTLFIVFQHIEEKMKPFKYKKEYDNPQYVPLKICINPA